MSSGSDRGNHAALPHWEQGNLAPLLLGQGCLQRHSSTSGWMPMPPQLFTECCVGLVLTHPSPISAPGVQVHDAQLLRPSSTPSWRMASRNGQRLDVTDGAAISTHADIRAVGASLMLRLISSVMVRDDLHVARGNARGAPWR